MFPIWIKLFGVGLLLYAANYYRRPKRDFPISAEASMGEIWPKPLAYIKKDKQYILKEQSFYFVIEQHTCALVDKAVIRAREALLRLSIDIPRDKKISDINNVLQTLTIDLTEACEDLPYLGMDEEYSLNVSLKSVLRSDSVWGVIRGLETFTQMFYVKDDEVRIHEAMVRDAPHYQYRGLMLDTTGHYISVKQILKTLDAMAMNKMNVFHWHLIDDESFPYVSKTYPKLSAYGAFGNSSVYTENDILLVVEFARQRGIRVIPEIDAPSHTKSFGFGHPEVLTKCFDGKLHKLGPMNPLNDESIHMMANLYKELQKLFPDDALHIGGRTADLSCWRLLNRSLGETDLLLAFTQKIYAAIPKQTEIIVWQDLFSDLMLLPRPSIVQMRDPEHHCVHEMVAALRAGHKVIFSSMWRIDDSRFSIGDMYNVDPHRLLHVVPMQLENNIADNVIGGEACMWGNMIDNNNVISRVWNRAAVVAEVLWSKTTSAELPVCKVPDHHATLPTEVYNRLLEQTYRMQRRGINAVIPEKPKKQSNDQTMTKNRWTRFTDDQEQHDIRDHYQEKQRIKDQDNDLMNQEDNYQEKNETKNQGSYFMNQEGNHKEKQGTVLREIYFMDQEENGQEKNGTKDQESYFMYQDENNPEKQGTNDQGSYFIDPELNYQEKRRTMDQESYSIDQEESDVNKHETRGQQSYFMDQEESDLKNQGTKDQQSYFMDQEDSYLKSRHQDNDFKDQEDLEDKIYHNLISKEDRILKDYEKYEFRQKIHSFLNQEDLRRKDQEKMNIEDRQYYGFEGQAYHKLLKNEDLSHKNNKRGTLKELALEDRAERRIRFHENERRLKDREEHRLFLEHERHLKNRESRHLKYQEWCIYRDQIVHGLTEGDRSLSHKEKNSLTDQNSSLLYTKEHGYTNQSRSLLYTNEYVLKDRNGSLSYTEEDGFTYKNNSLLYKENYGVIDSNSSLLHSLEHGLANHNGSFLNQEGYDFITDKKRSLLNHEQHGLTDKNSSLFNQEEHSLRDYNGSLLYQSKHGLTDHNNSLLKQDDPGFTDNNSSLLHHETNDFRFQIEHNCNDQIYKDRKDLEECIFNVQKYRSLVGQEQPGFTDQEERNLMHQEQPGSKDIEERGLNNQNQESLTKEKLDFENQEQSDLRNQQQRSLNQQEQESLEEEKRFAKNRKLRRINRQEEKSLNKIKEHAVMNQDNSGSKDQEQIRVEKQRRVNKNQEQLGSEEQEHRDLKDQGRISLEKPRYRNRSQEQSGLGDQEHHRFFYNEESADDEQERVREEDDSIEFKDIENRYWLFV